MLVSNRRTVSADGCFNDLNKDPLFKSSRVIFEIYTKWALLAFSYCLSLRINYK